MEMIETMDDAVDEATKSHKTDEAYWAFRSFATNLAEKVDDHDVDEALVEAITGDVASSVVINFEDVPQEMVKNYVDLPDNAGMAVLEPTPELVRLALLDDPQAVEEKLKSHELISARLPGVRIELSARPVPA